MKRLALSLIGIVLCAVPSFGAVKLYTQASQPATCATGDLWVDTDGTSGERFYTCESTNTWAKHVGYGTSANPSFNSVHASGGNLAAANKQVTKAWQTGLSYTADVTSVIHGGKHWIAKTTHTAGSTTEPGVGASYADAWTEVSGAGDDLGDAAYSDVVALWTTCTGYLKSDGSCDTPSGSATYPGSAGVANWNGSAWGTSYTVGTGANNLVQLNASSQLPAVSAALLTNFPTLNQNTTGTAAGLSGTPNITVGTLSAASAAFSVDATGKVTAKEFVTARTSSPSAIDFYESNTESGDNKLTLTLSGPLTGDVTKYIDQMITTSSFDDTPDNGSTTTAPTSNWAYDHAADTAIHNITAGASPTVDAAGEMSVDTTSDQFIYYGGAKRVLTYKKQFDFAIKNPVDADDVLLFKAQTAITITDIHVIAQGGTSISVDIQECDSAGANCATVDAAITADTDGAEDDGTLSNGTIDAGDWVKLVLGAPSGTVNFLTGSIYYVETAD